MGNALAFENNVLKRKVKIAGSGVCLGAQKVSSAELEKKAGLPEGIIFEKTGVQYRYQQSDRNFPAMATHAATQALHAASWDPSSLDAIISVSAVPYTPIPCNAIHIQKNLNLGHSGIQCFDMNATCLGFFPAFDLCSLKIAAGIWKRVMIICGDIANHALLSDDIETYGLFGDSATALCLESGQQNEYALTTHVESYGAYSDLCQIPAGGIAIPGQILNEENKRQYYFQMNGPQIFKKSAQLIIQFCERVFQSIHITEQTTFIPKSFEDIDIVIPHQASTAALRLIQRRLKIPDHKWINIVENYGNCISGSVPLALHFSLQNKVISKNQTIFLLGTGAGLSLAGIILKI